MAFAGSKTGDGLGCGSGARGEVTDMTGREQASAPMGGRISTGRRWAEYLVAILSGNVIYLFIDPYLPEFLQHRVPRIDPGLALDFLICVAIYGLLRVARGWD